MSAPSKTLMDFFQQPAAKRLKRVSSPPLSPLSSLNNATAAASSLSTTAFSSEQKLRLEFNKALALSKRNRKLCSDKVSKAVAAGVGYVKLEELLVEKTWSEVLSGELQKPYAMKLCEFVENEICHSTMPIYPPQHLIFNALNTTPFDQVKAVIIGQDPYHGPGQAMGLSFSVPEGVKVPSSLLNIYKELQQDLGCEIPANGNLERWAVQERGRRVTRAAVVDAHGLPCGYPGTHHGKFTLRGHIPHEEAILLIDESKHYVLKSAHPSGLSANRGFFGCRTLNLITLCLSKPFCR
ncbi:hypothetical protein DH2020_015519 [Rehmannia glutinosa]|uniref:Uracil-DNA glycosylase-like domain-containing protein n=1 Tax=Rehmannia glutinosa TaxID=99300 RepID=A0ABR0WSW8_REHGL